MSAHWLASSFLVLMYFIVTNRFRTACAWCVFIAVCLIFMHFYIVETTIYDSGINIAMYTSSYHRRYVRVYRLPIQIKVYRNLLGSKWVIVKIKLWISGIYTSLQYLYTSHLKMEIILL